MLKLTVKTVAIWAVLSFCLLEVSSESCSDPQWNEDKDEIPEINNQVGNGQVIFIWYISRKTNSYFSLPRTNATY